MKKLFPAPDLKRNVAHIPFNKPYLSGRETEYITQAVENGKISGDGWFTKLCHEFFEKRYGFRKVLLTTSCTDALEMAAILADIKPGDEVIMPSFTFVSTANAFVLRGAKIVFADSGNDHPNIDPLEIRRLVTPRTRAIVPVHYAGSACDMNAIMEIAREHDLLVIEDAAQAIDNYYNGKPLGSFGSMAAFSFHETKNIISGEGGMLVINDEALIKRAEIIREKGTNRSAFFRGEVDKYNWVDIGSSFLPSDLIAAFLYAQLEKIDEIQQKRKVIWERYFTGLSLLQEKGYVKLPVIPHGSTNNAHIFYLTCKDLEERTWLIAHLSNKQVNAVFHYLSLHKSPFFGDNELNLFNADRFSNTIVRLPLFFELEEEHQIRIIEAIKEFYLA